MASALQIPPITIEQYLGFEGYPGLRDELINGRIILSPQPKPHHQEVSDNILAALRLAFKNSEYVVKHNSNIRFDQTNSMPAPDVFVVRRTSWLDAIEHGEYLSCTPLIVIEVLSPANRRKKVEEKAHLYLTSGVAHVWICDPKRSTIFIARLQDDVVIQQAADTIVVSEPIPFTLKAPDLFTINP